MTKIIPSLWYVAEAEEAARFYTGLFPGSRIDRVTRLTDVPNEEGQAMIVDFTLFGQPFQALSAGPLDPFNHAVSFTVSCVDQAEVDRYWDGILAGGGTPEQCGWIRDRWGLCWQIVPEALGRLMADADRDRARRVGQAMQKMVKLDIAALEAA